MNLTKTKALRKVKNHIERRGKHTSFEATESMLMYWWKIINTAVFDNQLPPPKNFIIKEMKNVHGETEINLDTNEITFYIDSAIETREALICVLAHEMVHHWQQVKRTNVPRAVRMTHGKTFYQWKPIIEKRLGVKLEVVTDTDDVRID